MATRFVPTATDASSPSTTIDRGFTLVIHGGAGAITKDTPLERVAAYRTALSAVLAVGHAVLSRGGTALDGVEAAVRALEDCPLFNAGKGAVFTHDGTHELDASIMEGQTRRAGAICGVRHIEHPISLARAVMEHSDHVLLAGAGAEQFARTRGMPLCENTVFDTDERRVALQRVQDTTTMELDHTGASAIKPAAVVAPSPAVTTTTAIPPSTTAENKDARTTNNTHKFGTVGAVAVDRYGNVAAATSTGGMTNKRWGRIGDSPLIGAGTYADNNTAAISCTGYGEYFIRANVAYDITARMKYQHISLSDASTAAVASWIPNWGVDFEGGLIAVDVAGNVSTPFNSVGMYRGVITDKDDATHGHIAIWDEALAPVTPSSSTAAAAALAAAI